MSDSHYSVSIFGYLFTQSAMLFVRYGLKYDMPAWVTWFPTIITGVGVAAVLIILLVALIVRAIMDRW